MQPLTIAPLNTSGLLYVFHLPKYVQPHALTRAAANNSVYVPDELNMTARDLDGIPNLIIFI